MRQGQVRSFAARHKQATGGSGGNALRGLAVCLVIVVFGGVLAAWLFFFVHVSTTTTKASHEALVDGAALDELVETSLAGGAWKDGGAQTGLRGQGGLLGQNPAAAQGGETVAASATVLILYKEADCQGAEAGRIELAAGVAQLDVLSPEEAFHGLCHFGQLGSMKLLGEDATAHIDFYSSCTRKNRYVASLFPSEGCVRRYSYPVAQGFQFVVGQSPRPQITQLELDAQWAQQDHKPQPLRPGEVPRARIVFSCESAEYFGYQVWANYYGYLTSGQKSASWTRLLTAGVRDDLADTVKGMATFQAKRTLYSRRYSPINKPDVIAKWFASPDRPREEVIVVIDPDNWLLKDVSKYVDMVTRYNAVAEPAYYHGSKTAQKLWREMCKRNCDVDMDLVGVPYIVHREDLAQIAPLWRWYTIEIKDRADKDENFKKKFGHLDLNWAAEMFGYNMASTHVGVKHTAVRRIQVRDVDSEHRKEKLQDVAMLHVGRAWMPQDYAPAQRWAHTEGKSFSHFGQQVWCKCNYTASTVLPWPVPPSADFQSTKTLELMHFSNERFGRIPVNTSFRRGHTSGLYGASID